MKKIIRLTEKDLSRIVRRLIKEEEQNTTGGCYSKCLTSTNMTAKSIATSIRDACKCMNDSAFSNWDEVKFTNAVEKIKDETTYIAVNSILKCLMRESKKAGYFNDEPTFEPIMQLSKIMMDADDDGGIGGFEQDLADRVKAVVNKFF